MLFNNLDLCFFLSLSEKFHPLRRKSTSASWQFGESRGILKHKIFNNCRILSDHILSDLRISWYFGSFVWRPTKHLLFFDGRRHDFEHQGCDLCQMAVGNTFDSVPLTAETLYVWWWSHQTPCISSFFWPKNRDVSIRNMPGIKLVQVQSATFLSNPSRKWRNTQTNHW